MSIEAAQLKSFVERLETLLDEKKELSDTIKSVFDEFKEKGGDVKALKFILKLRNMKKDEVVKQDEIIELYREALKI